MKGGYSEDSVFCGNDLSPIYSFTYWQYINKFVYFSHGFVILPPIQWINACHRNNIKCFGTIITEGNEGINLNNYIINNTDYMVEKLVKMAKFYGFDGYFINIESPYRNEDEVERYMKFIKLLKKEMKERISYSEV